MVSVGEWVIDHVPVWVKEFAIRQFGTNDKPMLILGTVVLLAVFAVVIGILAVKRLWIGVAGIVLFGLVGMATAATRAGASPRAVVPALVGTVAAVATLALLLRGTLRPARRGRTEVPSAVGRRQFLLGAAAVGAVAATAGGVGRALARRFDVSSARAAVVLPTPASAAPALPAGRRPRASPG